MPQTPLYNINPGRNRPWNDLPELPVAEELYRTADVLEAMAEAKQALGRLQGRSIAIPNQGLLINPSVYRRQKRQAQSKIF